MRFRTGSGTVGCMERLAWIRGAARQHPYATDALLAAALAMSAQLELWTNPEMSPRAVLVPCSLLIAVPLAWRRRAPLTAVSVVMAAGAAQSLLTDAVPAPLSPLVASTIALYSVAAHGDVLRALAGGAMALAAAWIAISREHGSTVADYLYITLLCAGVWLGGRALRGWRLRAAELEDRTVVLEREREENARAAVAEERARIARELHDVIAHCVSLIVVQAGAERRALPTGKASTRGAVRRHAAGGTATRGRLRPSRDAAARAGLVVSVRILIADDQALVRAGLRKILESEPGLEVVAEAGDGVEACAAAQRTGPDVILMDIRMPRMDGLEATRRLARGAATPARILILTTFGRNQYVYDALRAGASGFLLKDAPPEELIAAVGVIARGDALLAPSITRAVIDEFARSAPAPRPAARARGPDAARARGVATPGARALQRRDRRGAGRQRRHGEDPRRARADEARPPRPRPGRHLRLRIRPHRGVAGQPGAEVNSKRVPTLVWMNASGNLAAIAAWPSSRCSGRDEEVGREGGERLEGGRDDRLERGRRGGTRR